MLRENFFLKRKVFRVFCIGLCLNFFVTHAFGTGEGDLWKLEDVNEDECLRTVRDTQAFFSSGEGGAPVARSNRVQTTGTIASTATTPSTAQQLDKPSEQKSSGRGGVAGGSVCIVDAPRRLSSRVYPGDVTVMPRDEDTRGSDRLSSLRRTQNSRELVPLDVPEHLIFTLQEQEEVSSWCCWRHVTEPTFVTTAEDAFHNTISPERYAKKGLQKVSVESGYGGSELIPRTVVLLSQTPSIEMLSITLDGDIDIVHESEGLSLCKGVRGLEIKSSSQRGITVQDLAEQLGSMEQLTALKLDGPTFYEDDREVFVESLKKLNKLQKISLSLSRDVLLQLVANKSLSFEGGSSLQEAEFVMNDDDVDSEFIRDLSTLLDDTRLERGLTRTLKVRARSIHGECLSGVTMTSFVKSLSSLGVKLDLEVENYLNPKDNSMQGTWHSFKYKMACIVT